MLSADAQLIKIIPRNPCHSRRLICTYNSIVVTGGEETLDYVTSYHLTDNGNETSLTPMSQGRYVHACGVYQDAGGKQVRIL